MGMRQSTAAELWRTVPGYESYKVSTAGRVASRRHRNGLPSREWRVLAPAPNARGYPQVCLKAPDKKPRWVEVHRLVWEVFVGPLEPGQVVRHDKDPDPMNNRLDNLAVGTQADNCKDKEKHGTAQKGERHPRTRLTDAQARAIKETLLRMSAEYGVKPSTLAQIAMGKTWKHLAQEPVPEPLPDAPTV